MGVSNELLPSDNPRTNSTVPRGHVKADHRWKNDWWTRLDSVNVRDFFGGAGFYGIPCTATSKDGDPLGRIVHDYGYHPEGSYSINSAHSCTSVKFLSLYEISTILDQATWLIKADLSSGYRQFGTHPVDWRFQVYCNGPNEHYIDLACPFGKTNSSLEFCPPVRLFAESAAVL